MRDDFSEEVKRILANRAAQICSKPDCNAPTSGPQDDPAKALNVGVAAHITAASQGGARYNPLLTSEQRASISNAVWLCQTCAKLIDNDESVFPEDVVRAWKTIREHEALHAIGKTKTARPPESETEKKLRKLMEWKGKRVMLVKMPTERQTEMLGARPWAPNHVILRECTEFFVVVDVGRWERSIPIESIRMGWDSKQGCVEILEYGH